MANQDQLVRRTLSLLGAGQAGQAPSPEDTDMVTAAIPSLLDDLARRNIIYVPDASEFDDACLQWLALLLAQFVSTDFGAPMDKGVIEMAESRLRSIQQQPWFRTSARVDYF